MPSGKVNAGKKSGDYAFCKPTYWLSHRIRYYFGLRNRRRTMLSYRVYCLDVHGRGVEAKEIEAPSDEEAVRKAQSLTGLRQCEVWRGHDLVAKITDFSAACA